jgi:hypothetical protein
MTVAAPPTVKVEVTQLHIERGVRHQNDSCPLALALHDAGYPEARVYGWTWNPTENDMVASPGRSAAVLSEEARRFVRTFDWQGAGAVQPDTFELPLPFGEPS